MDGGQLSVVRAWVTCHTQSAYLLSEPEASQGNRGRSIDYVPVIPHRQSVGGAGSFARVTARAVQRSSGGA